MAVVRNLMVRAGADFSDLYKEMKTANSRMGAFGKGMSTAFKGAAIGAAATVVGTYMKDAVYKASDLNEAMSATGQVFGDAFGQIEQFAKGSATQLGQTSTEIYNAARNFGVFGNAAGLAQKENAAFSKDLVGLATDLASFYNTSVEQATTALSAGLRGESEPLRQYGVLLDEATLRQRALAMGIVSTTTQALTPQQRVLAANAEIFAQSSIAQGDWARTNMGLAGQTKIFNAQLAELKVSLGQAFLPIVTTVMPILNSFVGGLAKAASFVSDFMNGLFGAEKGKQTQKQTNNVAKQSNAYKALTNNIKGAGSAAKGALAGFDEINSLTSSGGIDAGLNVIANPDSVDAAIKELTDDVKKKTAGEKLAVSLKASVKNWIVGDENYSNDMKNALSDFKTTLQNSANSYPMNITVTPKAKIPLGSGSGPLIYSGEQTSLSRDVMTWIALALENVKGEFEKQKEKANISTELNVQGTLKPTTQSVFYEKLKSVWETFKSWFVDFWSGTDDKSKKKRNVFDSDVNVDTNLKQNKNTFLTKLKDVWNTFWTWFRSFWNGTDDKTKIKNDYFLTNLSVDTKLKTDKSSFLSKLSDIWNSLKSWFNDFFSTKTLSTSISANVGVGMNMVGGSAAESSSSNIANIGKNARGGIVDRPSIGMVGEAGKEMIVPLENTQFVDKLAGALGTAVMTAMQMGGSGASGGTNIVIDGVALARAIQPYTSKESTRIGNSMIVAR